MRIIVLVISVLITFCYSCSSQLNTTKKVPAGIIFDSLDQVKIKKPISKKYGFFSVHIQKRYNYNGKTLMPVWIMDFHNQQDGLVIVDSASGQTVKEFLYDNISKYPKQNWIFHHPDSIFVIFRGDYHPKEWYDSCFVRIDTAGKIHAVFSIANAPFGGRHHINPQKSEIPMITTIESSSCIVANKYWVIPLKYDTYFSDHKVIKHPVGLGGHFDITNPGAGFVTHPVYYPEYMYGHQWATVYESPRIAVSHRHTVLYHFSNNPLIIELDPATNTIVNRFYAPSYYLDTVTAYAPKADGTFPSRQQFERQKGYFHNLVYDPVAQMYYRKIRLAPLPEDPIEKRNEDLFAIQMLDTNFKVIAEDLTPENTAPVGYTTLINGGVAFYMKKVIPIDSTIRSTANIYKLRKSDKPAKPQLPFKSSVLGVGFTGYFKYNYPTISQDSSIVMIIPIDNSCPNCLAGFIREPIENHLALNKNLHLIIAGSSKDTINNAIKAHNIPLNHPQIHFDSTDTYKKYVVKFINPKLLFMRNGKILREFTVNPGVLEFVGGWIKSFNNGENLPAAD